MFAVIDCWQHATHNCECVDSHMCSITQPDNPAQVSGKIYEMMGMAISGKWSRFDSQQSASQAPQTETLEAEVVEAVEAGSQK